MSMASLGTHGTQRRVLVLLGEAGMQTEEARTEAQGKGRSRPSVR